VEKCRDTQEIQLTFLLYCNRNSDKEVLVLVTLSLSYSELHLNKAASTLTGYEPSQLESSLTHCLQRQIPSYVQLDSTVSQRYKGILSKMNYLTSATPE